MNNKVKRIPSIAENTKIFNVSIVTGLRNVVPDGRAGVFYPLFNCWF